jgi:hypothetical protein
MTDIGYALIVLKRDGAVVEVRNKGDGLAEVTVEIGDHKVARVIPSTVADNSDSAEFARVVRDLEEDLFRLASAPPSTGLHVLPAAVVPFALAACQAVEGLTQSALGGLFAGV